MRLLRSLLLASGILVLPLTAAAQASPTTHRELRLSWVRSGAAAACPDAGHVQADVERRLGWSPFVQPSLSTESIEAFVTRENEHWRATIELRAADGSSVGSRQVESPADNCASLAAAAGLAIALMIEPLLPIAPTSVAPAPPPAPPPAVKPDVAIGTGDGMNATVGASGASGTRGHLALGAFATLGILPSAAVGAIVSGSTRLVNRWFGSVSVSLLPEQHVHRNQADVGFGMTLGAIGPCYRIPIHEVWSVSACASLLLGSLQVAVSNPEPVAPGARFWWGASTGLRLGWNAGPFATSLGVDAVAHWTRHTYLIDRTPPLSSSSSFVEPAAAVITSLVAGVQY